MGVFSCVAGLGLLMMFWLLLEGSTALLYLRSVLGLSSFSFLYESSINALDVHFKLFLNDGLITPNFLVTGGDFSYFYAPKLHPSLFFQDFEVIFSYTEIIDKTLSIIAHQSPSFFFIGAFFVLMLAFCIFYFAIRAYFSRNDSWKFFFKFLYTASWVGRLQNLDTLNQLTRGNLYPIAKDTRFFAFNLYASAKTRVNQTSFGVMCFEYHFSQTAGGVTGFVDLFPGRFLFNN